MKFNVINNVIDSITLLITLKEGQSHCQMLLAINNWLELLFQKHKRYYTSLTLRRRRARGRDARSARVGRRWRGTSSWPPSAPASVRRRRRRGSGAGRICCWARSRRSRSSWRRISRRRRRRTGAWRRPRSLETTQSEYWLGISVSSRSFPFFRSRRFDPPPPTKKHGF